MRSVHRAWVRAVLVVGVSGSPRVESNSEILLRGVLEGATAAGASVELVRLRQL